MNKNDIKQIILEEIKAAINEMASPEELAADSRPEDDDRIARAMETGDEDELEDLAAGELDRAEIERDWRDEQDAMFGKPNFVEEEGLEEMARTSNIFKLSQEASMKDVLQFMQRVNDVLKTYKSPGQKRPKKRFTPEEMKALAIAMLNPEGFTSKDIIANTSYNSPAQANKFLKALEMKGLITLTSQLKKAMEPTRDPNAPETRGRKRRDSEFDMPDDALDMDFGDFDNLDLSDPLAENKSGRMVNEISVEKAAAAVRAARDRKEYKRAEDISNTFFRTFVGKDMTFGTVESIELDGQIFSDADVDKGSVSIRIDVDGVSDEDKMKLLRYNNENPDRSLPRIFSNQPFSVPSHELMNYPPELQTLRDDSGKPVVLGPAITGDQDGFSYYGQGSGINLRYFMGADNITYNQGGANINITNLPLSRRDVRILQQIIMAINPDSRYAKPGTSEYKVIGLREAKQVRLQEEEAEKKLKALIAKGVSQTQSEEELEEQGMGSKAWHDSVHMTRKVEWPQWISKMSDALTTGVADLLNISPDAASNVILAAVPASVIVSLAAGAAKGRDREFIPDVVEKFILKFANKFRKEGEKIKFGQGGTYDGSKNYDLKNLYENKMTNLEKYIKQQIREAKNPLATKMKEIETQGRVAALETKLAAVAEMIEETESRLTRIDEDNEFRDMMDRNAVKEVRKQLKELERAQAKLQKEYDKVSGGRKKEKVVGEADADKLRDLADRQDALDQELDDSVEEVSFELNESTLRMQKLANIIKG